MQSKIKKSRTSTEVRESRSAGCAANTKEEDVVEKVGPAASPTFSELCQTEMKQLVEAIASVGSIYDIDFKNLVEENELSAGENLVGKVEFVLANTPYNIRRDLMAPKSKYDVFELQGMKDMARSLGDMMKPGALRQVLCSSLQFSLSYQAVVPQWTEESTSISEDADSSGSESDDGEQVEQQPFFEVNTTVMHYNRAVGNYQKNTAAKCAA